MPTLKELEEENLRLRNEIEVLKSKSFQPSGDSTVSVPESFRPLFSEAEKLVHKYFSTFQTDPSKATVKVEGERYLLVRASALSYDFLNLFKSLYKDKGESEALKIGKEFLFDIAHMIGLEDSKNFHTKMNVSDPIARLSAGPVHFAYTGWAYVDILPESSPSPDENYFLKYHHPFSFEADAWLKAGVKAEEPVCIMNSGYSSGWCEESFGIPLTAVEISCKACGDENCTFIMAPPEKIHEHLERELKGSSVKSSSEYLVPMFFERKKVEEEMELAKIKAIESDQSKTIFLANMSHEIRTPLNSILGYVDLMLKDTVSKEHGEWLGIIRDSGNVLKNILNDILDLSKIQANELVINNETVVISDLRKFSESSLHSLLKAHHKNFTSEVEISEELPKAFEGDLMRIKQILWNLISNAVKYTRQGCINVRFSKEDDFVRISVEDTGVGIPENKLNEIWEDFKQVDPGKNREVGGTGLGLAITNRLVQLMGGYAKVNSVVDEGSDFLIYLPLIASEQIREEGHEENSVDLRKSAKVLLVDDNMVNLGLTKRILERNGHQVVTAKNGMQAIESFNSSDHLDVIIMDIQMPFMDGLEATKSIRDQEIQTKKQRIPIIALTAHALKEDMQKCADAGCDGYLTKPIDMDDLLKKIEELI